MNSVVSRAKRWKAILLLNVLYAGAGILWMTLIPYNNAPDENTHFRYTVEFIIKNHRLPVWGVDDLDRFSHALSSYNQMPALNYVAYAAGAAACHKIFGLETYFGARLISLGWGIVFLNFLFLAARELCGNEKNALLITAAFALIPQVFFVFCYINADAHALAISAVLGFALARLLHRQAAADIIFAGAAIGLLFSAKYNYFIYLPFLLVLLGLAILRGNISRQTAVKLLVASVVMSLLISGFWFLRNYILYGQPIPLLLSEDFFKSLAIPREVQPVNRGLNVPSIIWLIQNGFISTTFNSFFAVFGYMNVGFHREVYIILRIIILLVAFFVIIELAASKDRTALAALAVLLIFICTVIAMHIWTCLRFDYQPQGRYQFAILTPLALFSAWAVTRNPSLRKHAIFFMIIMAWFFIGANLLIVRTYGPPARFTVSWHGPDKSQLQSSSLKVKRIKENTYAIPAIPLPNAPIACMGIELPKGFLARYRDFQVEFDTDNGAKLIDWASTMPEQMTDLTFDKKLNAFEVSGANPCFRLPLTLSGAKVNGVKISYRMENRRPYDMNN